MSSVIAPRNRLLLALSPCDLQRIQSQLHPVLLRRKRILCHSYLPFEHVYFVESGSLSVVVSTEEGNGGMEMLAIGVEGMVGIPLVLEKKTSPHRCIVQVEGSALRMRAADLLQAMDELSSLRPVLLHYANSALVQIAQTAACNARHTILQRLARWLLTMQDRLGSETIPLTHDVASRMLGVRRSSITENLHVLAQSGAISVAERGVVRIRDRHRLEAVACSCYRTMKAEFDQLALQLTTAGVHSRSLARAKGAAHA